MILRSVRACRGRFVTKWHAVSSAHPAPNGVAEAQLLLLELAEPELPEAEIVDPFDIPDPALPGSAGEHLLQCAYGDSTRAQRFYADQVTDHLNEEMVEFVRRMEMAFIATSDGNGEADCSFRAGPPGFITVLGQDRIAYPEFRGNGVHASLGNISENPHVGLLMVDFVRDLIGLHINGRAHIVEHDVMRADYPGLPADYPRGMTPQRWVVIDVVEAYVHCRKHIPRMEPVSRERSWGSDDMRRKGGDYFAAKSAPSPWNRAAEPAARRR